MNTSARTSLARALAQRLSRQHGDALLLMGVFGSTARGDDTTWSDLDLLAVISDGAAIAPRTFIFQGIAVDVSVVEAGQLEAILGGPQREWPYYMGVLDGLQVLTGDAERRRRWLELGQSPDESAFRATLERELPALVFESYGRVRSCGARRNERDAAHAAVEILYEIKTALCLLNRRWVTRDYYAGFEESFAFPLRPFAYEQLVPQLWSARELDEIVVVAGQLVGNYWRLLTACGLNVPNYQTVESIPL